MHDTIHCTSQQHSISFFKFYLCRFSLMYISHQLSKGKKIYQINVGYNSWRHWNNIPSAFLPSLSNYSRMMYNHQLKIYQLGELGSCLCASIGVCERWRGRRYSSPRAFPTSRKRLQHMNLAKC